MISLFQRSSCESVTQLNYGFITLPLDWWHIYLNSTFTSPQQERNVQITFLPNFYNERNFTVGKIYVLEHGLASSYPLQLPWPRITLYVQYSICRCMSPEIRRVYAHDTSPHQIIVVPLINVLFAISSTYLFIEQKFHVLTFSSTNKTIINSYVLQSSILVLSGANQNDNNPRCCALQL
jgi:hypothetical protein